MHSLAVGICATLLILVATYQAVTGEQLVLYKGWRGFVAALVIIAVSLTALITLKGPR